MRPSNNPINFGTYAAPSLTPSVSASLASIAQWATDIVRASFQVVITGSANGSLQVQFSNDFAVGTPRNTFQPTNWNNIGNAIFVSGAGSYALPSVECSYEYIRVIYTDSSNGTATGSITSARICAKGL